MSLDLDAELRETGWGRTELAQEHVVALVLPKLGVEGDGGRRSRERQMPQPGLWSTRGGGSGAAPARAGDQGLHLQGSCQSQGTAGGVSPVPWTHSNVWLGPGWL